MYLSPVFVHESFVWYILQKTASLGKYSKSKHFGFVLCEISCYTLLAFLLLYNFVSCWSFMFELHVCSHVLINHDQVQETGMRLTGNMCLIKKIIYVHLTTRFYGTRFTLYT